MQTSSLQPYKLIGVTVENNIGVKFNIIAQVMDVVIHQDIFGNGMYGHISVTDSEGVHEALGFHGDELVEIVIQDLIENKRIELPFISYAVSPKIAKDNQMQTVYTINFCSAEMLVNANECGDGWSKEGNRFPNILELYSTELWGNIFNKKHRSPKKLLIGKDVKKRPITVHANIGTSPFGVIRDTIRYLTNPKSNNVNDFLFYENWDGYNIKSISEIASENPKIGLFYGRKDNMPAEANYFNIIEYSETETHDSIRDSQSGLYSSTVYSHDPVMKRWSLYKVNYADYHGDMDNPGKNGIMNEASSKKYGSGAGNIRVVAQRSYVSEGEEVFDTDAANYYPNSGLLTARYKQHLKKLLYGPKINILVHGSMLLSVAKPINVIIGTTGVDKTFTKNPLLSGKYIVTAVAHVFTITSYYTHAECSKTGFDVALPGKPMVKTKSAGEKNKEEKISSPADERNKVNRKTPQAPISIMSFPSRGGSGGGGGGGSGGGGGGGSGGGGSDGPGSGSIPPTVPDGGSRPVNSVPVPSDNPVFFGEEAQTDSVDRSLVSSNKLSSIVTEGNRLVNAIREQDINMDFNNEFMENSSREEQSALLSSLLKRQKASEDLTKYIKQRQTQRGCE